MSLFKQLIGVLVVLLVAGGGFAAYEHTARGSVAEQDGGGPAGRGDGAVPVALAAAEVRETSRGVEAVGTTRSRRAIEVEAGASGQIREIAFEPGQTVSQGDVLARLDDEIEKANLEEAEAALREGQLALERARTLRQSATVTEATLEQHITQEATARAARNRAQRRLDDREVRAPFAGIVGLKRVDEGARVAETTVITTLDDRSEMELEFSLPELIYGEVSEGQRIAATSVAFPGRSFEGTISSIDSRIDPTSRSFRVRALLPNPDLLLPAGMFMHVTVTLSTDEAVMVPEESMIVEGDGSYVYVAEDDRAVRRSVEVGQREVGYVEILDGVAAGEPVVVEGLQRLRDGAQLRIIGLATDGADDPDDGTGEPSGDEPA